MATESENCFFFLKPKYPAKQYTYFPLFVFYAQTLDKMFVMFKIHMRVLVLLVAFSRLKKFRDGKMHAKHKTFPPKENHDAQTIRQGSFDRIRGFSRKVDFRVHIYTFDARQTNIHARNRENREIPVFCNYDLTRVTGLAAKMKIFTLHRISSFYLLISEETMLNCK